MEKLTPLNGLRNSIASIKSILDTKANKEDIRANVQPDWNQNDETADDYVKNRPFYTGEPKSITVEILPEINSASIEGDIILSEPLVEGRTYTVTCDGIEYECVARNYDGYLMLGNNAIYEYDGDITTDTGEPFAMETEETSTTLWVYMAEEKDFTLSISYSVIQENIVKLPMKYLPDGYPYKESYSGEIVPETTINIESTGDPVFDPFVIEFVAGGIYNVTWDGIEYECVSYIVQGPNSPSIGNGEIAGVNGGNGEPFFCTVYEGQVMLFAAEVGTHTISISGTIEKVVQMSSEYIPKFTINVDVTYDPHPNASAAYFCTMDKSVAEIAKAYLGGLEMRAINKETGEYYILETAKQGTFGDWEFDFVNWKIDGDIHFKHLHMWTPSSGDAVALYTTEQANAIYEGTNNTNYLASVPAVCDFVNSKCYISYNEQELTEEQQAQARKNIGAANSKSVDCINLVDQENGYTYAVCMRNGTLVTYCQIEKIEVTTMPNKTEYMVGEIFDPTGIVITATTYDGVSKEVTNFEYDTTPITDSTSYVKVTYTEGGMSHAVEVPVAVIPFDPEIVLVDFDYTDNGNGTYTITGWKETYSGQPSTELIIPNNSLVIL